MKIILQESMHVNEVIVDFDVCVGVEEALVSTPEC